MNLDDAYWMYRAVGSVVEGHYSNFIQTNVDYVTASKEFLRGRVAKIDAQAANLQGDALTQFLTEANHATVKAMKERTMNHFNDLLASGLLLSKLTFNMDKNL